MFTKRIRRLFGSVSTDAIYITSPENLRYFSGFTGGEGALILQPGACTLFTDSRYLVQAAAEAPDCEICDTAQHKAADALKDLAPETIGFESGFVTHAAAKRLFEALPQAEWVGVDEAVLMQRAVKDAQELELTRQAAALADDAFSHVLPHLRPGVRELDVALELEWYMRQNGASAASFPIICASGLRSALPHGVAGEKVLAEGDFVTMDFGCFYNGYASDMTRTVVLGKASLQQKTVYDTVLRAQEAGLAAICAGKTGSAADRAARQMISEAGYGDYFGHALGHGTGLQIHEQPVLSTRSQTVLKPNMLVTVEPGIYIEDFGGVRIEDLVIVTEEGCENLTHSDKQLLEIV